MRKWLRQPLVFNTHSSYFGCKFRFMQCSLLKPTLVTSDKSGFFTLVTCYKTAPNWNGTSLTYPQDGVGTLVLGQKFTLILSLRPRTRVGQVKGVPHYHIHQTDHIQAGG
jgi:hypothetical protein